MIQNQGREVDCHLELDPMERGPSVILAVIFREFVRGRNAYRVEVNLDSGKHPLTLLKSALAELETATGLRFESFETVDIVRAFIEHAERKGYRIRGLSYAMEPK